MRSHFAPELLTEICAPAYIRASMFLSENSNPGTAAGILSDQPSPCLSLAAADRILQQRAPTPSALMVGLPVMAAACCSPLQLPVLLHELSDASASLQFGIQPIHAFLV